MYKQLNPKLKKVLWNFVFQSFVVSYFLYIQLDIWERSRSVQMLFLYSGIIYLSRLLVMPLIGKIILKNKVLPALKSGYVLSSVLGLAAFLGEYINNLYILMLLYGTLVAVISVSLNIGYNFIIANAGKEKDFGNFFYLQGFVLSLVSFIMSILVGAALAFVSRQFTFLLLVFLGMAGLKMVDTLRDQDKRYFDENFKLRDLYIAPNEEKSDKQDIYILLFVFVGMFVLQYIEISRSAIQFMVGNGALGVGLINASIILVMFFFIRFKDHLDRKFEMDWFYMAAGLIAVSMLGTFLSGKNALYMVAVIMVISYYLYDSNVNLIAFSSVEGKSQIRKFGMVFNREIVRNIARAAVAFSGYVFSFDTLGEPSYKFFLFVVLIILGFSVGMYTKIKKTSKI